MFNTFSELAESLNLPTGTSYHVGIKRDPSDYEIFRRASDEEEVQLDGWFPTYPKSDDRFDYLVWGTWNDSNKNKIYNFAYNRYFICEYRG